MDLSRPKVELRESFHRKILILAIGIFLTQAGYAQTENQKEPSPIKINDLQIIGSHNSYKKEIQPALLALISQENKELAMTLDYHHISLAAQLDLGLRSLELDLVNDPQGGKYSRPYGNVILKKMGINPVPYDTLEKMKIPGFKVMHIPDLDFQSWCYSLKDGLYQIKKWSDENPDHLPVIITFNAKTDGIDKEGFTSLLPFTRASFDSLDIELTSVFPPDKIIKPDDIRGQYPTLNQAVRAGNWPLLSQSRGKVMFVLDEQGEKQHTYLLGHPALRGRVMFVNAAPGSDPSAFLIINDPVTFRDSISRYVKEGYMVRTRSDADTQEARKMDYKRLKAAMESGAQIISTDYYLPDEHLGNGYQVSLPHNKKFRYNPILLPISDSYYLKE